MHNSLGDGGIFSNMTSALTAGAATTPAAAPAAGGSVAMPLSAPVPLYTQAFYKEQKGHKHPLVENKEAMLDLYNKFRKEIEQASRLCNVPLEAILGIMFVENGRGNPSLTVPPVSATGLMMLTPATADTIIIRERKAGRLTQDEAAVIVRTMGAAGRKLLLPKTQEAKPVITTTTHLKNAELNVLIGAMALGHYMDQHTEGGIVRLDKTFIRYNQGWYYKGTNGTPADVLASAKSRSSEAYNYLLKMLGTNGVMHAWVA